MSSSCSLVVRVRGLPERRMQVPVCGTAWGLDNDAGFVVVLVVLVLVFFFRCPDHPLVLPTKGFPFKWAPTTPPPRPTQPLGSHVYGKDLHSSGKIKYDLLLQGEDRAEAGADARAGAEATLCQKCTQLFDMVCCFYMYVAPC